VAVDTDNFVAQADTPPGDSTPPSLKAISDASKSDSAEVKRPCIVNGSKALENFKRTIPPSVAASTASTTSAKSAAATPADIKSGVTSSSSPSSYDRGITPSSSSKRNGKTDKANAIPGERGSVSAQPETENTTKVDEMSPATTDQEAALPASEVKKKAVEKTKARLNLSPIKEEEPAVEYRTPISADKLPPGARSQSSEFYILPPSADEDKNAKRVQSSAIPKLSVIEEAPKLSALTGDTTEPVAGPEEGTAERVTSRENREVSPQQTATKPAVQKAAGKPKKPQKKAATAKKNKAAEHVTGWRGGDKKDLTPVDLSTLGQGMERESIKMDIKADHEQTTKEAFSQDQAQILKEPASSNKSPNLKQVPGPGSLPPRSPQVIKDQSQPGPSEAFQTRTISTDSSRNVSSVVTPLSAKQDNNAAPIASVAECPNRTWHVDQWAYSPCSCQLCNIRNRSLYVKLNPWPVLSRMEDIRDSVRRCMGNYGPVEEIIIHHGHDRLRPTWVNVR
jgi:hypothetical protein